MFGNKIRKVINEINLSKSNTLFHLLKDKKNAGKTMHPEHRKVNKAHTHNCHEF
jgi:hypothetical protein